MNFTPFGVPLGGSLPVSGAFTNGKFTQNLSGQVVGVLQGGEGGVHYIRPVESTSNQNNQNGNNQTNQAQQVASLLPPTLITLPITMPGAKPGDPQQTVQIQVMPKYQVTQLPIQAFQQSTNGNTVFTVAYNGDQQNGMILDGNQGLPEGVTVVAALQPHDLQLIQTGGTIQTSESDSPMGEEEEKGESNSNKEQPQPVALVKAEHVIKTEVLNESEPFTVADYIQRIQTPNNLPLSLNQFLKFNPETIKRESQVEYSPLSSAADNSAGDETQLIVNMKQEGEEDGNDKTKKKKKYKKKPPKPKKPKPGQVHIVTALDGTTLFCCPECHMAYPEKELLEQHLIGHKIERRFICDICGAGLKRKEHLERHKLGHNPDRPFICSVCMKGFKRKEHLNLHYVIHSGCKSEVCGECGKGFYRKDHLRKHARSHAARRLKEEMQQAQAKALSDQQNSQQSQPQPQQQPQQQTTPQQLTIHVSNETMEAIGLAAAANASNTQIQVPVQIQVPQHHLQVCNGDGDGSSEGSSDRQVNTVVLPSETNMTILQHVSNNGCGDEEVSSDNGNQPDQRQINTVVLPAGALLHQVGNNECREENNSESSGSERSQVSTVVLPTAAETGAMALLHQATTSGNSQQH